MERCFVCARSRLFLAVFALFVCDMRLNSHLNKFRKIERASWNTVRCALVLKLHRRWLSQVSGSAAAAERSFWFHPLRARAVVVFWQAAAPRAPYLRVCRQATQGKLPVSRSHVRVRVCSPWCRAELLLHESAHSYAKWMKRTLSFFCCSFLGGNFCVYISSLSLLRENTCVCFYCPSAYP